MNIFSFGIGLIAVVILLINIAPVISESVSNVDSNNPDIDDNAINLARTMPFLLLIGAVLILSFFWWRGGYD